MSEIDRMDRVAALAIVLCVIVLLIIVGAIVWALWAGIGWQVTIAALAAIYGLRRLS